MTPHIFTGRYSNPNVPASGLIPVGITRYPPRFRLAYELKATLYDLAPTAAMLTRWKQGTTIEAFLAEYEAQLEQVGIEQILGQLVAMQGVARGIVLLCYEDVAAGESCHRRMLAEWLKRRVGIVAPELPDPGRNRAGKKKPKAG